MSKLDNTLEFTVGDPVLVTAFVETAHVYDSAPEEELKSKLFGTNPYSGYKKTLVRQEECPPVPCVVTGAKRVFSGRVSSSHWYDEGEYSPRELKIESSTLVYLVRRGLTNRELMVLPADLTRDLSVRENIPQRFRSRR